MLPDLRKSFLDRTANVLTILVAIVFFGLLIQKYFLRDNPTGLAPKVYGEVAVNGCSFLRYRWEETG